MELGLPKQRTGVVVCGAWGAVRVLMLLNRNRRQCRNRDNEQDRDRRQCRNRDCKRCTGVVD